MTIYFHCGLTKTGAAAIQEAFSQNRELLAAHGLYYPLTPAAEIAHNNFAYQMSGDRRFDPKLLDFLTAQRLCSEFNESDVLFSSEGFESLLHRPKQLQFYLDGLRNTGHHICLILYTRDQNDYAMSLYPDLLAQGYAGTYLEFIHEIHLSGFFKFVDSVYQFDGTRLQAALAKLSNIEVVLRDFDEAATNQSVVADFTGFLKLAPQISPQNATRRLNEPVSVALSLADFYKVRVARELTPAEISLIGRLTAYQLVFPSPRACLTDVILPPKFARMEKVYSERTAQTITKLSKKPSIFNGIFEKLLIEWWNR